MARVKIPYYVLKKGFGYWQPKKEMRDAGFRSVPCGKDGPKAWAVADAWNDRWQRHRRGVEEAKPAGWPPRSIGDAFDRYRRTEEWAKKKPRTREEWERGFARIKPVFGDLRPVDADVSLETLSVFRKHIHDSVSPREAWRTIKIWRAIWTVCGAMGFTDGKKDPSSGIRNEQPAARSESWSAGETVRLVKAAWRMKHYGLAAAIAVSWDTMLSPVDIRGLTVDQMIRVDEGAYFVSKRTKTGRSAIGTVSRRTEFALEAYLALAPISVGPIFRNRSGAAYSRFTLPDDFADVRERVFPGDKRTLADMRRSGALEARAGGANPATLSAKMANSISTSNALHRAYQPVDLASVREADEARRSGRQRMRTEPKRSTKVGTPEGKFQLGDTKEQAK